MRRFLIALTILLPAAASGQTFTPPEPGDLVKFAFAGCTRTQLSHPDNAGADVKLLEQYCRCTANRMTAQMSRAEVQTYEANNKLATEALMAKAHRIGLECRQEIFR